MTRPVRDLVPNGARRVLRRLRPTTHSLLVLGEDVDATAVRRLAGLRRRGWAVRRVGQLRGPLPKAYTAVAVASRSLADLRSAMPLLAKVGRATRVVVVVTATDRPEQFVLPATLTANRLERGEVRVSRRGHGGVAVTVELRRPTAVLSVVRAVVSGPRAGAAVLPAAGLRVGLTSAAALPWAAGDPWARWVDARALTVAPDDISPVDVVVGHELRADPPGPGAPPLLPRATSSGGVGARDGWAWAAHATWDELAGAADRLDVDRLMPPVDTFVISPRGFDNAADGPGGRLVTWPAAGKDACAVVDHRGGLVSVLGPGVGSRGVGEDDVRRLRGLMHVSVDPPAVRGPVPLARLLSQLLVAGVPVITGALPPGVRRLLGDDLADRLETLGPETTADRLEREAWSVGARRQALLRFGSAASWRETARSLGTTASPAPDVSVLLATRRPSNLAFALAQLERQTWPHTEVVVALHGVPEDHPDVQLAVTSYSGPLQVLAVDARVVFGDVLNAALARCSGRLVAKVDDDDWYGPDHVTDLVLTHAYSGATLVGCADHFTYLEASDLTIRDHVHRSETWASRVSGGTLALARDDLVGLGGWRPVRRAVDRCLIQAVGATGGQIYAMHDMGFCLYRGAGDHTWQQEDDRFLARDPEQWTGLRLPAHVGEPVPR